MSIMPWSTDKDVTENSGIVSESVARMISISRRKRKQTLACHKIKGFQFLIVAGPCCIFYYSYLHVHQTDQNRRNLTGVVLFAEN